MTAKDIALQTAKNYADATDSQIYALKRGGMDKLATALGMDPKAYSSQVKLLAGIRHRIRAALAGDAVSVGKAPQADLGPVRTIEMALKQCTPEQLRQVNKALKAAWRNTEAKVAISFAVGDEVWFVGRSGDKVEGVITKINQKTIQVKQTNGKNPGFPLTWRVSPSLLRRPLALVK
jgi:hypothetical protein